MDQSELYVVATPLGNRLDITLRAIECLKKVKWVFAEDTRETHKLFELCGISAEGKKFHSYASHNLKQATQYAAEILKSGESIALVCDRGTPGISDPGALLVAAARESGVKVVPLPGPSAVAALVSVCGLEKNEFLFLGFLPKENKPREQVFDRIRKLGAPACFYESPRRVRQTFEDLKAAFPNGSLFFGREITKMYEQFEWLNLSTANAEMLPELGEYVLMVLPGETTAGPEAWEDEVRLRMASDKEWAKSVGARFGIASRDVYNALQRLRGGTKD